MCGLFLWQAARAVESVGDQVEVKISILIVVLEVSRETGVVHIDPGFGGAIDEPTAAVVEKKMIR